MRREATAITVAVLLALSPWQPLLAGSQLVAEHAALATDSPYATQIGLRVLRSGGNAIDAAVAVAFALAVAQPQSGNLGGGGFLTYYDAGEKGVWVLDFREAAPAGVATGKPSLLSGAAAAAVPATVAGLAAMHRRFGTRPWRELVTPAARLATEGVRVDAELAGAIAAAKRERRADAFTGTSALFYPGGNALTAGATLIQPQLAATLARIAEKGAADFYQGEIAGKLVEEVRKAGGTLSLHDLRTYSPVWRAPIRLSFKNHEIYTTPPPSAGGLMIGSTLKILSPFDLRRDGFQSAGTIHLIAEASRRAAIDRDRYLGDPVAIRTPLRDLLSDDRAAQWRSSIQTTRATPTTTLTEPGTPSPASRHTTHITIVDAKGDVAALTTTLGNEMGSGFLVPRCGFLLNDALHDFSDAAGVPNSIAGGKRMATSIAPTIVFHNGKPLAALGTSGGGAIPEIVSQILLRIIVDQEPLATAVTAPRFDQQAAAEELGYEPDLVSPKTLESLTAMGHASAQQGPIGNVNAIMWEGGKLVAVADPRHGGAAGGY